MNKNKVVVIAFAFALVLLTATAQPVVAASRYDTLSSYMADNYDAIRGGYLLPFDGVTRIDPTYGALSIMDEIGALAQRPPQISITMAMEFSENHQWLTGDENDESSFGGFSNYLLAVVTNDVNYHGLLLWQILKSSALGDIPGVDDYEINVTANAFWINKTVSEAGGYSDFKESNENMMSTYYALASYRILQNMYPLENVWTTYVNETAVLTWIESCRDGDSYKLSPESSRTSVSATAAAVLAYEAIDPASTIPGVASVQSWLVDRQVSDYQEPEYIGGFEEGNATDEPNIVSTYFALSALNSMTALSNVNATSVVSFILNCQATDGSWGNSPGFAEGSLLFSAYVCQMLNMLDTDSALGTLSSSIDPSTEGSIPIDWRIVVVVGVVLVAALIALYSLRMD